MIRIFLNSPGFATRDDVFAWAEEQGAGPKVVVVRGPDGFWRAQIEVRQEAMCEVEEVSNG